MGLLSYQAISLWLANGPGTVPVQVFLNKSAELKLGHIPGETLIKQPHILHLVISGAFCHCIAWRIAYASFLPGAQCPESQLEPVNWTNLNCQCMFVVGCLRGTGSTTPTENLGQRKPAQRCQLRKKKEWQEERWYGDSMGSHIFFLIIFKAGITNCD